MDGRIIYGTALMEHHHFLWHSTAARIIGYDTPTDHYPPAARSDYIAAGPFLNISLTSLELHSLGVRFFAFAFRSCSFGSVIAQRARTAPCMNMGSLLGLKGGCGGGDGGGMNLKSWEGSMERGEKGKRDLDTS